MRTVEEQNDCVKCEDLEVASVNLSGYICSPSPTDQSHLSRG